MGQVYAPTGAIKAVGDYRLKIRGVVYGGHDLVGDTFLPGTDLGGRRSFLGMPDYYDHTQRGIKSQIGEVVAVGGDDEGIDFTIELDRAKRYADEIMRLYRAKALGGSTGAAGHLVVREGGILKRWVIAEISLTPTPAEPRTVPTKAIARPQLTANTREVFDLMVDQYAAYAKDRNQLGARYQGDRLQQTLWNQLKSTMGGPVFYDLINDVKKGLGL